MQSNAADHTILHWDMHRMKRIAQSHMLRDVEWHSLNCALTYATLGIWKPHMKGTLRQ